jgi:hypothetical protein
LITGIILIFVNLFLGWFFEKIDVNNYFYVWRIIL